MAMTEQAGAPVVVASFRYAQRRSERSLRLTSQGFALISLRDMGVEEVRSQESEWRRQWRQPRRKREQNSRFCGHNGLAKASALISLRDMGVEEVRSQRPTILRTVV